MPSLVALLLLLIGSADARKPRKPPTAAPVWTPTAVELTPAEQALVQQVTAGKSPPAEYVFVLETAGPMLDVAKGARGDIARIVQNLPAGDRVEVVSFHVRTSVELESTAITDEGRAALVEKIRNLDLKSAKDTDLGAGLAYTVERLGRPDAPRDQFVFVLSTFCHNPSLSSPYDSGGRGCRAIKGFQKIVDDAAASAKTHVRAATLLATAAGSQKPDPNGLRLVADLFPGAAQIDTATTPFPAWAAGYAKRAPLERVLPLARAEAQGLTLSLHTVSSPTASNPVATVELASSAVHLGLQLNGTQVEGAPAGSIPERLELAPTVTLEIPVTLPSPPFAILPGEATVQLPVRIIGDGTLLPAEGLQAAGIEPLRPGLAAAGTVPYTYRYGISWVILVATMMVVSGTSVMGFMFLRRKFRPVRLGGAFSYRRSGGQRVALDIAQLAEVTIGIDENGDLAANRGRRVLTFRMVPDGDELVAEVEIHREGVEINRRPARPGVHRVVPGATSVQFGEYRIAWE